MRSRRAEVELCCLWPEAAQVLLRSIPGTPAAGGAGRRELLRHPLPPPTAWAGQLCRGHCHLPWLCGYPHPHVPGEQEAFAVLFPRPAVLMLLMLGVVCRGVSCQESLKWGFAATLKADLCVRPSCKVCCLLYNWQILVLLLLCTLPQSLVGPGLVGLAKAAAGAAAAISWASLGAIGGVPGCCRGAGLPSESSPPLPWGQPWPRPGGHGVVAAWALVKQVGEVQG